QLPRWWYSTIVVSSHAANSGSRKTLNLVMRSWLRSRIVRCSGANKGPHDDRKKSRRRVALRQSAATIISKKKMAIQKGEFQMPYISVGKENSGDINIYYKDCGSGQPVVFSHGWPSGADASETPMGVLATRGYRCTAHARRGHGRSSQPWNGNEMDTYADDLAKLVEALDLKDAVHVGHSTGGGEVARYIGRHGTK